MKPRAQGRVQGAVLPFVCLPLFLSLIEALASTPPKSRRSFAFKPSDKNLSRPNKSSHGRSPNRINRAPLVAGVPDITVLREHRQCNAPPAVSLLEFCRKHAQSAPGSGSKKTKFCSNHRPVAFPHLPLQFSQPVCYCTLGE